jgi:hypothetical protein
VSCVNGTASRNPTARCALYRIEALLQHNTSMIHRIGGYQ